MPIHAPSRASLQLDQARGGRRPSSSTPGARALYAALNLVAYIDMMTMLVIFLLMSFSATRRDPVRPEEHRPARGPELDRPRAGAGHRGVGQDVVTLDGEQMATMDELMQDSATGDFKIAELHDLLVTLKNNYKLLHPTEDFNGIAIIQSDKNVEFKALRKIMFTAQVAGYNNVNFAVGPKAKGGGAAARVAALTPPIEQSRPVCLRRWTGRLPFTASAVSILHPFHGGPHMRTRLVVSRAAILAARRCASVAAAPGDPNDPAHLGQEAREPARAEGSARPPRQHGRREGAAGRARAASSSTRRRQAPRAPAGAGALQGSAHQAGLHRGARLHRRGLRPGHHRRRRAGRDEGDRRRSTS